MVKNSRRKKQARRAAAANGTNYTTALRTQRRQPELPEHAAFPRPGSAAFDDAIRLAGEGVMRIGVTDNGYLDWDLNALQHGILLGRCGSGKTVTLDTIVTYGLARPDELELLVCDPSRIELSWIADHVPAGSYATTGNEMQRVLATALRRAARTQSLLDATGARSLLELRAMLREDPTLKERFGPAPKRTLVVVDDLVHLTAHDPHDPRGKEVAEGLRRCLEELSELGPELGVNFIWSTQHMNMRAIGRQLSRMPGFRVGLGPLEKYQATQLFGSSHYSELYASSAKGRAIVRDGQGDHEVQMFELLTRENPDYPPPPGLTTSIEVLRYCSAE